MTVSVDQIKKLREETGAGVMDVRKALEQAGGEEEKALELLRMRGLERAKSKAGREIRAGRVFSYVHHTGTVGGTVVLGCETDFVARTDDFLTLGNELAMQVASMGAVAPEEFKDQEYIRDSSKTIGTLVQETAGKLGENVQIIEIKRFEV